MKKILTVISCALLVAFSASTASAVTLSTADSNFIGTVDPATPSNTADAALYTNYLVNLSAGTHNDVDLEALFPGGGPDIYDFVRTANCPACPDVTGTGAVKVDTNTVVDLNVSVWSYILAKYGTTGYVWYIADNVLITLPGTLGGNGLSHYTLFNPGGTFVPDGGTTLSLLGLGMLGLGYLRRRMS